MLLTILNMTYQEVKNYIAELLSWLGFNRDENMTEIEHDPMGFLDAETFICPPFLLCRE